MTAAPRPATADSTPARPRTPRRSAPPAPDLPSGSASGQARGTSSHAPSADELLDLILGEHPPAFAVLHRPGSAGHLPTGDPTAEPDAELLIGEVSHLPLLADLPAGDPDGPPVLAIVPFRQVTERGFDVVDDGAPLLALRVTRQAWISLADLIVRLPADAGPFEQTGYDVPDDDYRTMVTDVLANEIAGGEGSNFVLHRALTGRVSQPPALAALGALRQLLLREQHAYWTFAVHTPQLTLVGATPERHVSLDAGVARMNPISGTLRYPPGGWDDDAQRLGAVLDFLADAKERDELSMVLDEELKMMAQAGDLGGRVVGPYLKEMAHLAHTEYVLEGRTSLDARDVLRATMFAPTVTGSPIRNACRVIARHERRGRGYYGGVLALLDHDREGRQRLDAPILIRTAYIAPDGRLRIPAGATLVRGSKPESELAETRAKAAGILSAFRPHIEARFHDHGEGGGGDAGISDGGSPVGVLPEDQDHSRDHGIVLRSEGPRNTPLTRDPLVVRALTTRNDTLARFWLHERPVPEPGGRRITVVDAEDDFTAMLAHLLRSLGLAVTVLPWYDVAATTVEDAGTVVLGPGPGDPSDLGDPRIAALHAIAAHRLAVGLPTLGICLGHQVLGLELGLEVRRLALPDQGVQSAERVFGVDRRVGFYNSFVLAPPRPAPPGFAIDADAAGTRIVALRGPGVAGLQFHPESVLTTDGLAILRTALTHLEQVLAV